MAERSSWSAGDDILRGWSDASWDAIQPRSSSWDILGSWNAQGSNLEGYGSGSWTDIFRNTPAFYDQRLKGGGPSFDPGSQGESYDPFSGYTMKVWQSDLDEWMFETYPELFTFNDPPPGTGSSGGGTWDGSFGKLTNAGGAWAMSDQANSYIANAAAKFGVPENLIKSMIMRESSGDWASNNYTYSGYRDSEMLPYVGIFRNAAETRGINFDAMKGNQGLQIEAMAQIISELSTTFGGFGNAAKVYFGGERALTGTFYDENGLSSDYYFNQTMEGWRYLDSLAPNAGAVQGKLNPWGQQPGGSFGTLNSIWGGANAPLTQEFGPTDFSAANPGWYDFGKNYGASGHTGLDIGLAVGTQLYSPVNGTVVYAGGTGFYCSPEAGGCGPGVGELRIRMDNGQEVILGHNSQISVQPGQRITAGQPVALVGSMNGAHVHIEYRVPDSSTASGWRIVDPRQAFAGTFSNMTGPGGTATVGGGQPMAPPPMSYEQLLRSGAMGKPITQGYTPGAGAVSGWNAFLQRAMMGLV